MRAPLTMREYRLGIVNKIILLNNALWMARLRLWISLKSLAAVLIDMLVGFRGNQGQDVGMWDRQMCQQAAEGSKRKLLQGKLYNIVM